MALKGLFRFGRSRDKPRNLTVGSAYRPHMGTTPSGQIVNERTSMQMSAVYACVRVLAEGVAQLPLHFYVLESDGNRRKATDHPYYSLLHDEPNPEMTSFTFRETAMTHLLLWGNFFAQIIRDGMGNVVALYPLMPNHMVVDRDEKGRIYYTYYRNVWEEAPTLKGEEVTLYPEDVLHIPALGFDGLVGYSPIAMAKNAIGMSIACDQYGASFFKNGASPSGVLEYPGVVKDPEKVRSEWEAAYGNGHAHRTAVLEQGMKYTPISINPQDAQFLETRKFQIDEIARIFRVPPHMIGDLDHATFSNIEEQSLEFVTYSLQPWLIRIEAGLRRSLLRKEEKRTYFWAFNVDGLLRGNYATRMQGYATGFNNGFLSVNDIHRMENMDLLPKEEGGDLHLVNGNMMPLEMAGAAYQNGTAAGPQPDKPPDPPDEEPAQKKRRFGGSGK